MRILLILFSYFFIVQYSTGQPIDFPLDTIPVNQLDAVVVEATRLPSRDISIPLAVSSLDTAVLQSAQQQLNLEYALNTLPGLFVLNANNYAQDLRISIRGFGARSAFGIRGIKLLVDGIPESTPDGQGQMDNIDIGILAGLEIIRGPASGLYGNAAGGVISLKTEEPPARPFIESRVTAGSFGLQRYQLKAGGSKGKWGGIVHASYTELDGFRAQSKFLSRNVQSRLRYQYSANSKVQLLFSYVDSPTAQDPGSLTSELLENDRRAAWENNERFDAGESVQHGKIALKWDHKWGVHHQLRSNVFYQWRDFDNRLPFESGGIVQLNRQFAGGGISYQFHGNLLKRFYRLQAGIEIEQQDDDRQRFNNLEGRIGERTFRQDELFRSTGSYLMQEWRPLNRLLLLLTLRWDVMQLEAKDRFLVNGDDSGIINYRQFNPSVGFHYQLDGLTFLYSNFSSSFETPALSELSANPNGDGGFNGSLSPQQATNFELGIKHMKFEQWKGQVAFYHIWLENELIPFELAGFPDRRFYRNAGQSTRFGIEASMQWQPISAVRTRIAYTFTQFEYQDFTTSSGSLSGNSLPGVPPHHCSWLIDYTPYKSLSIQLQQRYVSDFFADDANTTSSDAYYAANIRLSYRKQYKSAMVAPFIGCNNVTNTRYNDNIRINAFGRRYFEPAAGINWFAGLRIRFLG